MTWQLALILVSLAIAFLALAIAIRSASRVDVLRDRLMRHESDVLSLRGALSAISEEGMLGSTRGDDLERRLRRLSEQQEQLMLRDPDDGPYHQALRLAARGASAEELVQGCGLSRGEADLVLALHRPPSGDAEAPDRHGQ